MLNKIKQISEKAKQYQDKLINEEITKTALILPFVAALGYDVTNPFEVVPEFHADYPDIKADKVDLCIMVDDNPTIMIECKKYQSQLDSNHKRQLAKYFHWIKSVKIAILTNGNDFEFYSDLKSENVMDTEPFLKFNVNSISDNEIKLLELFTKGNFNINEVLSHANKHSAAGVIFEYISENFNNPSDEYITFLLKQVLDKLPSGNQIVNQKLKESLKPAIIEAQQKLINFTISERLQVVIQPEIKATVEASPVVEIVKPAVETTQEEIEGYNIIRAICSELTDPETITIRDAQSYCAILFNDNNRKPIARLHFNSKAVRYVETFKSKEESEKHQISKVTDIFKYSDKLRNTVKLYMSVE